MTSSEIIKRYSWQFRGGRGIDHSVPPHWLPTVEALCNAIEEAICEAHRPAFYWLDIKEKRGMIAVDYVAPANMTDTIEALIEAARTKLSMG